MKFQKKNPFLLCNFSDAALHKNERPMSDTELLAIDGVGKAKLEKYGDAFIKVQDFQKAKGTKRKKKPQPTKKHWNFKNGLTVEKLLKKKIRIKYIMSHLAKLYVDRQK
jgi:ATP-dependent DNA helicase RecQ